MSGHSKWSTIKHKKAARDHARGNVFTKMANAIAVAVKKGGGIGDPEMNFALRLAVEKARAVNMPMENIKRAIDRGLGQGDAKQLMELTIEGFGPMGVAIIVEAVSDNHNRTIGEIRTIMEKNGGTMGVPGSVAYQFERAAIVSYEGELSEMEQLELIDAGASDFAEGMVIGGVESTKSVTECLEKNGHKVVAAELRYLPKVWVEAEVDAVESFLDLLRELDDVQEVYSNVAE